MDEKENEAIVVNYLRRKMKKKKKNKSIEGDTIRKIFTYLREAVNGFLKSPNAQPFSKGPMKAKGLETMNFSRGDIRNVNRGNESRGGGG